MEISGSYVFNAPVQKVWDTLMDPKVLAECIPGCESFDPVGDGQYQAVVSVGVGAIRGRYNAKVVLRDLEPPSSYRLIIEGTGSVGFVNGDSLVTLQEGEGNTTVRVESNAQVGGTIARVGQRMMGSVAKTMLDRFFTCLQQSTG